MIWCFKTTAKPSGLDAGVDESWSDADPWDAEKLNQT